MRLGILTLNIANPSAARAERLLEWLGERPEHIFVLTETSAGTGSCLIADRLRRAGWEVRFPHTDRVERGVAVASRVRVAARAGDVVDFLPARAEAVTTGGLDVVGLYVPSRDDSQDKTARKRRFCTAISSFLARRAARDAVVIGDLNVLEPVHRPHYAFFRDWEYRLYDEFGVRGFVDAYRLRHADGTDHSWLSLDNQGFRFDHAFVTHSLEDRVVTCEYLHETRKRELTDHSALTLELEVDGGGLDELEVDGSLSDELPALF